ncbi:MAG: AI-2E family transporter [Planctomycetota bacterium]
MSTPETRADPFRWLLGMAALVIVVAGLRAAQPLVVPFLVAAFLAVLCAPAMQALEKRGLPQMVALGVVILGVTLLMLAAAGIATRSIADFVGKDSEYRAAIRVGVDRSLDWLDAHGVSTSLFRGDGEPEFSPVDPAGSVEADQAVAGLSEEGEAISGVEPGDASDSKGVVGEANEEAATEEAETEEAGGGETEPEETVNEEVGKLAGQLIGFLTSFLGGLSTLFSNAFLVLMTVLFMLLEASGMSRKLIVLSGGTTRTLEQAEKIRVAVLRYTTLKTWISLLLGACVWLLLRALGVKYAELWALMAFLLNFIPNIGSFIAAIPAVIVALIEIEPSQNEDLFNVSRGLLTAAGYGVINLVVSNLLEPKVMGKDLGLSALVVFVSLVFWGWVLGPVGLLFSVPLTMVVKIVMENFEQTRWFAVLLSADPEHLE